MNRYVLKLLFGLFIWMPLSSAFSADLPKSHFRPYPYGFYTSPAGHFQEHKKISDLIEREGMMLGKWEDDQRKHNLSTPMIHPVDSLHRFYVNQSLLDTSGNLPTKKGIYMGWGDPRTGMTLCLEKVIAVEKGGDESQRGPLVKAFVDKYQVGNYITEARYLLKQKDRYLEFTFRPNFYYVGKQNITALTYKLVDVTPLIMEQLEKKRKSEDLKKKLQDKF